MTINDISGVRISDGFLDIPEDKERIKIDVGLSWCAPNSAAWLVRDSNLFVIGVEANRFACERLGHVVLNPHKPYERCDISNDNYMLINCAIDDVVGVEMKTFYHVGDDPGTSSLLKPTSALKERHGLEVEKISDVPAIPLSLILGLIPPRFGFIEQIKTDCQGKDLDVIMSAGGYIHNVVFLDCEISTAGLYEKEINANYIISKIKSLGFKLLRKRGANASFVNTRLSHFVSEYKLNNYTTRR